MGLDGLCQSSDVTPCVFDGAFLRLSHPVLDLGGRLLDRIEIGRIGREIPEPCAGGPDRPPHSGGFVAAEIVHHHDVAFLQDGRELLCKPTP